jgi:hypothetical protein
MFLHGPVMRDLMAFLRFAARVLQRIFLLTIGAAAVVAMVEGLSA